MSSHRDGIFRMMELKDGVCLQKAGIFFGYVYFVYYYEKKYIPHEDNLSTKTLLESAYLFLSTAYTHFDSDEARQFLCAPEALLGMRYYRAEFLPLILKVVKRKDDRERILSSSHRHISVEQAVLRLGKELEMDRPENGAASFFTKVWEYFVEEKRKLCGRRLKEAERASLVKNAFLFCPALYRDFNTDQSYQHLCDFDILLGMKYYRVELLPLILEVVQRRDDKERIRASLHRHIPIEEAVLQLGKDLGKDRPENALWKGKPDPGQHQQWTEVYRQFGDFSLEDEYSLTD